MNNENIEGNWEQIKGHAKTQWGKLTDDDLTKIKGNTQIMLGKLQEKYGYGKEEAERELDDFMNSKEVKSCNCSN